MVSDPDTGERRFARVKVPDRVPAPGRAARRRALPAGRGGRSPPSCTRCSSAWWSRSTRVFRVTRNADLTLEDEEADDLLEAVEMELRRRRFGQAVRLEVAGRRSATRCSSCSSASSTSTRATCHRHRGADRPHLPVAAARRSTAPTSRTGRGRRSPPAGSPPPRRPTADLLGHPRPGAAGAPPVRELRQQRRGVHRPGGRRPAGAVDQDDAVPRRRRQPDRPQPDPRRRARRAGGRAGRAQGPLRRGDQRQLGQGARARRRARRLRPGRAEDALQVRARRARRRRRAAPLLPHRHRQLQLARRPGCTRTSASSPATPPSAPTSPSCSTTSPATAAAHDYHTLLVAPRDLRRQLLDLIEHEAPLRRRGPHHAQAATRSPTRTMVEALYEASAGRRADRPAHPRHLLPARRACRGCRENIRVRSDPRSLPRAQPDLSASPTATSTAQPLYLIGSADLMPRNLDRRVEVLVPVEHPKHQEWLDQVLDVRRSPTTSCAGSCSPTTPGSAWARATLRAARPGAPLPLGRRAPGRSDARRDARAALSPGGHDSFTSRSPRRAWLSSGLPTVRDRNPGSTLTSLHGWTHTNGVQQREHPHPAPQGARSRSRRDTRPGRMRR